MSLGSRKFRFSWNSSLWERSDNGPEWSKHEIGSLQTKCFVVENNHYEFHGAEIVFNERGTCVDVKGNFRLTSFVDSFSSFSSFFQVCQEEEGSMVTNLVFMLSRSSWGSACNEYSHCTFSFMIFFQRSNGESCKNVRIFVLIRTSTCSINMISRSERNFCSRSWKRTIINLCRKLCPLPLRNCFRSFDKKWDWLEEKWRRLEWKSWLGIFSTAKNEKVKPVQELTIASHFFLHRQHKKINFWHASTCDERWKRSRAALIPLFVG